MYWIEIRRSPLLWCLPVLLVVDLAAVFGRSQYWIGIWPQASAAAQIPALFFAPAFAAAAAWAVGRTLRRGIEERYRAAARPQWHMEALQFLATATYGLGVYAVGALAAAVVSIPDAGPGFLWPSYLLLGGAVILGCSAIGHVVGRYSRSMVAAPVICGLACFVAIGGVGSPRNLGLYALSGDPGIEISWKALAARIFLAFALTLAAIFTPGSFGRKAGGWGSAGRRVPAMGAVFSIILGGVLLLTSGALRVDRDAPHTPLCSQGSPRVCIWPENRKYLPQISAMAERIGAIPQSWIRTPATFYELGVRPVGNGTANDFSVSEGNLWFAAPNMAGSVIQLSIPIRCESLSPQVANEVSTAMAQVEMWLEFRAMGTSEEPSVNSSMPRSDLDAAQRIAGSSEKEQDTWVKKRLKVIQEAPCA
ncbi:hypothetical protein ACFYOG_35820 [Streptomyces sp. NPDC007818]|uniref:DUF7224 domain-containing protein n=1 Tax=Streptomyces sp. NPDC007818 TaxID=3364780 RepID=UPI003685DAB4